MQRADGEDFHVGLSYVYSYCYAIHCVYPNPASKRLLYIYINIYILLRSDSSIMSLTACAKGVEVLFLPGVREVKASLSQLVIVATVSFTISFHHRCMYLICTVHTHDAHLMGKTHLIITSCLIQGYFFFK